MQNILITSFYKFHPFQSSDVPRIEEELFDLGKALKLRGLTILATEGINATISGPATEVEKFKDWARNLVGDVFFKDSESNKHPFHDFKIKIRPEIVTLDRPELVPQGPHHHLSPEEWHRTLQEDDVMVLDTRNDYEVKIGKFKKAIDPGLKEFNEFPEYLKKAGLKKDQKILIYCTGGIRCEKAILEMNRQGFNNVYQLDGGIINYLRHFPHQEFEGECFVFDYRVAVDQELKPSQRYRLCPHCGNPAEKRITCIQCQMEEVVCVECTSKGPMYNTCSKNCAHHYRMGHRSRRPHLDSFRKRSPSLDPKEIKVTTG